MTGDQHRDRIMSDSSSDGSCSAGLTDPGGDPCVSGDRASGNVQQRFPNFQLEVGATQVDVQGLAAVVVTQVKDRLDPR